MFLLLHCWSDEAKLALVCLLFGICPARAEDAAAKGRRRYRIR
ncbi:hypothetical protein HDC92_003757 [Pedobacter sp. AK017]|nr:hypothetical protein [Pedobacter sp. AK017]